MWALFRKFLISSFLTMLTLFWKFFSNKIFHSCNEDKLVFFSCGIHVKFTKNKKYAVQVPLKMIKFWIFINAGWAAIWHDGSCLFHPPAGQAGCLLQQGVCRDRQAGPWAFPRWDGYAFVKYLYRFPFESYRYGLNEFINSFSYN